MKIFVTGGSGLVGCNFIRVATELYKSKVWAALNTWRPTGSVPFEWEPLDLCNREEVLRKVRAFQPDAIVHCAILRGLSNLYSQRHLAWQSYVETTRHLTEAAGAVGAKMILISTDWVFDGTQGPANEVTPPNPINYYGVLKLVCETLVSSMSQDWAVARISGVNGVHWFRPELQLMQNAGFGNLVKHVVDTLRDGRSFAVWVEEVNEVGTPTLATDAAEMILKIIRFDQKGVFHCCGGESASRMELAVAAAKEFGLDPNRIRSSSMDEETKRALQGIPIPKDTRLSASRTGSQLEHSLMTISQALRAFRYQLETGKIQFS
jgi:dTDP-4-dehydrorhamnose reductase